MYYVRDRKVNDTGCATTDCASVVAKKLCLRFKDKLVTLNDFKSGISWYNHIIQQNAEEEPPFSIRLG